MFNWRNYLTGLIATVINGAAGAVALVIIDPLTFHLGDLRKLGTAALVLGLISAANYLKQPFPFNKGE